VRVLRQRRLVYIDESFCKTGMCREHAWSPRGQRAPGKRPMRNWKTVSLIGAIRLGSKPKLMTHRGAVNGVVFRRFIRHRLVPWLRRGDVVLMDNLNMHKSTAVRAAIEAAGATAAYLPTYSPELNPIELLWAHLKRQLRTLALATEDALLSGVRRLRRLVPLSHVEGWFRHALDQAQIN
jgi:transposase